MQHMFTSGNAGNVFIFMTYYGHDEKYDDHAPTTS